MAKIYTSLTQLIGGTPLLELVQIEKMFNLQARLLAKLEYLNPAGSVKDRVALSMILDAEEKGLLKPGSVIIEPTSGNTGIGLAAVAAGRGYKTVIVMPDSMSAERRMLMTAYGAELVLTPGALGMSGAIEKANELASSISGSFIPAQFDNPANARAHWDTTGPEIWQDTGGKVDFFVAVEPAASPLLSGGKAGPHGLQGIGANFVPKVLNTEIYDAVIPVTEEEAYTAGRLLGKNEGILAGISSGAALHAAIALAAKPENAGKTVVVLLPDTGDRYLSTPMFMQQEM